VDVNYRIRDLCRRHHPETVRLFLLSTHYRRPLDFTERRLEEAAAALQRLQGLIRRLGDGIVTGCRSSQETGRLAAGFCEAMNRDLNVPEAIAQLFASVRRLNRRLNHVGGMSGLTHQDRMEIRDLLFLTRNLLGIPGDETDGCFGGIQKRN
jgi:cysteinyl-tRNA synthetase